MIPDDIDNLTGPSSKPRASGDDPMYDNPVEYNV